MTLPRLLDAVAAFLGARDAWRGDVVPGRDYSRVRDDEARAEAELRAAYLEATSGDVRVRQTAQPIENRPLPPLLHGPLSADGRRQDRDEKGTEDL